MSSIRVSPRAVSQSQPLGRCGAAQALRRMTQRKLSRSEAVDANNNSVRPSRSDIQFLRNCQSINLHFLNEEQHDTDERPKNHACCSVGAKLRLLSRLPEEDLSELFLQVVRANRGSDVIFFLDAYKAGGHGPERQGGARVPPHSSDLVWCGDAASLKGHVRLSDGSCAGTG